MRRFWLVFALLLSLGINLGILSAIALNRQRPPRPPRPPALGIEQMAEALELTGEERRAFVERHRRYWDLREDAREKVAALRREMREGLLGERGDLAALEASIRRAAELNLERELAFARLIVETRASLSGDQRRRYQSFIPEIRGVEPARPFRRRDGPMIDSPPNGR